MKGRYGRQRRGYQGKERRGVRDGVRLEEIKHRESREVRVSGRVSSNSKGLFQRDDRASRSGDDVGLLKGGLVTPQVSGWERQITAAGLDGWWCFFWVVWFECGIGW